MINLCNNLLFLFVKQNAFIVEQNNPGCENIYHNCSSSDSSRPSERSARSTYESNQNFEMVFNLNQVQEIISILQLIHNNGHQSKMKFDAICDRLETFNSKQSSFAREFTGKPMSINKTNKTVLIRKHDLNQYMSLTNSTKPRLLAKFLEGSNLSHQGTQDLQDMQTSHYIDNMDLQMLSCKQRIDAQYYKQTLSKWMNTAWDSFRVVDNNTNNVIFMLPDDPLSPEFLEYASKVSNPTINLETIRQKLNYRYYNNLDEFISEMNQLFDNWVQFKGKSHRMYQQCDNMKKRFQRFIERNKQKLSENTSLQANKNSPNKLYEAAL